MRSRVNLVTILLTLSCVIRMLEGSRSEEKHKTFPVAKKPIKEVHHKVAPQNTVALRGEDKTKVVKTLTRNNGLGLSKDYLYRPERPRRRKRKMDRTMMALLMAYKLKFVALIPTLVGGLILLKATALLAGFFFALFAAVLGLKVKN
ncbi:uncharacterized protein LOC108631846 [Ceratina calcarata]|uniref:Uncharacterized protein LOC108631846 n=1 Tax=Ceratina calcarata TaxID=156304 RepID=A0AAJ7JFG3_9HYME|nr:uncharacterized protein LOC108631846 [Ceratina calcarata]XP_026674972.1 uncharacterized protein LOC108631846 [Ceratina calcarata]